MRTLAIDIGGSKVKALVLDETGEPIGDRQRIETPRPATPESIIAAIRVLVRNVGEFDRVSVGFPGVVRHGVTYTAPNLDPSWHGTNLAEELTIELGAPTRVANDADVQGLGAIAGLGVELVLTLGTGLGSSLFVEGRLVPNLEVGHHRFRKGKTYEQTLGQAAFEQIGVSKWNKKLLKAIEELRTLFNFDRLYLGGGNTKHVSIELPADVTIVSNLAGLFGGLALWRATSSPSVV